MNILFLSREYPPNSIGGVASYVYEMSSVLAQMGHRVFIITEAIDVPCEYEYKGVNVIKIKPYRFTSLNFIRGDIIGFIERLEYSYSVYKAMKKIIKKYNIDIVEAPEARAEGFFYYLFHKKPFLCIKLHTPESIIFYRLNQEPITFDHKLIRYLEEFWLRKAKKIISLSKAIGDLTADFFKLKNNFPIVPNPIDIKKFYPISKEIKKEKEIILFVGRLEFRKGIHIFIKAIPYILKEYDPNLLEFFIIGADRGMKSYILEKIEKLGIKNYVYLLDNLPRNRLVQYYHNSDIVVIPSLWENHPYVLLEAMACGKAIVATDIGGIPEIIENKFNGILIPAGSALELAKAVVTLLKDKNLRINLGKNARETIEKRYSPYKIAENTLKIYNELLKK